MRILFAFFLTLQIPVFSQDFSSIDLSKDYKPQYVLDTAPSKYVDIYVKAYQEIKDAKKADKYEGKVGKEIMNFHVERIENLYYMLHGREILYEGPIYDYLNGLMEKIKKANNISKETRLFVLRENTVNASSWGEGSFLFHLGLLSLMENESQVVGILCHELAHYILDHSEKKIKKGAELVTSDVLKKQVSTVMKSEYDRYRKMTKLMKRYQFNYAYHSREVETEADSIGYVLMSKTNYDLKEFGRVMDILDSNKTIKNYSNLEIPAYFKFDSIPMKADWFAYQLNNTFNVKLEDDEDNDSLNTHPDCKLRKQCILARVEREGIKSQSGIDNSTFNKINAIADFELVEQYFENEKYVRAMFQSMFLLNKYPNNKYLHSIVDKNLMFLYYFTKGHKQTRILRFPHIRLNENYNRFLSFLQKLSLSEINKFKVNYHQMYLNRFGKDENTAFYDTYETMQNKREFKEKEAIVAGFKSKYSQSNSNRILQRELDMNNPKNK